MKQPRGHRCAAPRLLLFVNEKLLLFVNEKQRAQRSGKPALSYPRKRVSSGTRRGGARLAVGGSSKQPKFRQRRGILDARVRGHDTRETPHPGSGCLVQRDRPKAGNELAMTNSWRLDPGIDCCLGLDRKARTTQMVEEFREPDAVADPTFQYLTGMQSFPDPQTLRRFLLQAPESFLRFAGHMVRTARLRNVRRDSRHD